MTLCGGSTIQLVDLGLSVSIEEDEPVVERDQSDLDSLLVSVEKETILKALEKTRWNKTAAAKALGVSFGALRYRMQKLGLE